MAAALQTARHAPDERARQSIQRVMVPQMVVSLPRSKNLYEKLSHSFLTELYERDEQTQHRRDQ
ncbi:MAG: hypothetical protein ACUVSL_18495, partial [Chloroflexus sp.]